MSRAVKPGRKTARPPAAEVSGNFSIYVNPSTTQENDPDGLQAKCFPTLRQWRDDGVLKPMVLTAISLLIDAHPEISAPLSLQYAREQAQLIAKYLVPELKQHLVLAASYSAVTQQIAAPDFDDFSDDAFIRNYVHYEEDYKD
jgi:hypothetical protein